MSESEAELYLWKDSGPHHNLISNENQVSMAAPGFGQLARSDDSLLVESEIQGQWKRLERHHECLHDFKVLGSFLPSFIKYLFLVP